MGTHQVTVLKNIKPVAIIPGRILRIASRPRELKLACQGYVVTCSGTGQSSNTSRSSDNLVYTWEVRQSGVVRTNLVSRSRSAANFLLLLTLLK